MPLSLVEREIVMSAVRRFLHTKEHTSRLLLIKRVKDPNPVDNLVPVILKTGVGERLWPGVLAFEYCGDRDAGCPSSGTQRAGVSDSRPSLCCGLVIQDLPLSRPASPILELRSPMTLSATIQTTYR